MGDRLPANATYYRGEIPKDKRSVLRFIDEFVMGQLENERALDRLPDLTTRTAVVILIETGLRSVDCLRLRYDPITVDEAGAPYLLFYNHKLSREAIIPISQRLVEQIRRQQHDLVERFGAPPPIIQPRVRANPDGHFPFIWSTLNERLRRWLGECEVRDATGQPVSVTAHRFRHTVGTRMINNNVPMDTVQQMLDHLSPEMTARYANGYCGLPLQQTCPHPNACLTCNNFLTTTEFLPIHIEQLERTEQLQNAARESGRERLVEMNEPLRLNLVRIIGGLQTLPDDETEQENRDD